MNRKKAEGHERTTHKNANMLKRIVARSFITTCPKIKASLSHAGVEISLKTV